MGRMLHHRAVIGKHLGKGMTLRLNQAHEIRLGGGVGGDAGQMFLPHIANFGRQSRHFGGSRPRWGCARRRWCMGLIFAHGIILA